MGNDDFAGRRGRLAAQNSLHTNFNRGTAAPQPDLLHDVPSSDQSRNANTAPAVPVGTKRVDPKAANRRSVPPPPVSPRMQQRVAQAQAVAPAKGIPVLLPRASMAPVRAESVTSRTTGGTFITAGPPPVSPTRSTTTTTTAAAETLHRVRTDQLIPIPLPYSTAHTAAAAAADATPPTTDDSMWQYSHPDDVSTGKQPRDIKTTFSAKKPDPPAPAFGQRVPSQSHHHSSALYAQPSAQHAAEPVLAYPVPDTSQQATPASSGTQLMCPYCNVPLTLPANCTAAPCPTCHVLMSLPPKPAARTLSAHVLPNPVTSQQTSHQQTSPHYSSQQQQQQAYPSHTQQSYQPQPYHQQQQHQYQAEQQRPPLPARPEHMTTSDYPAFSAMYTNPALLHDPMQQPTQSSYPAASAYYPHVW
eukprot:TRINITY_DN9959_c0_g1_i1.p1 TRINITY_DN9959_c0_g1~~TRINITY_DN9959_c0_g1_i1.p1  ORF type:complete len:416 (+),score=87.01 TRINITY_DN9959_c0_g1_i1:81-1328(+)